MPKVTGTITISTSALIKTKYRTLRLAGITRERACEVIASELMLEAATVNSYITNNRIEVIFNENKDLVEIPEMYVHKQ